MISETALMQKIKKEMSYHRNLPETEFVQGLLGGLKISLFLLTQLGQEGRNIREAYKGRLSRWSAAKFRNAIDVSLGYLKRGDRARGIRILEAAVEHEGDRKQRWDLIKQGVKL